MKIAKWESRSGKWYVKLYFNPTFRLADGTITTTSWYQGVGCGGSVPATTELNAIAWMEDRLKCGYFQPDAAKTEMKRVY